VLLLGVGARIVLDPGVYDYYTAGLLLGALCWELLGLQRPVPVWSLAAFTGLHLAPGVIGDASLLGTLRLWTVALLTAGVLLLPQRWCAGEELPGSTADAIADPAMVSGDVHRLPKRFEMVSAGRSD
jgi:hypothetical protein